MSFRTFFGLSHGPNLVLTIGSSRVSAVVFRASEGKPEILAVSKSDIVLGENLNFKRFIISTREAIEEALRKLQNTAPRPRKIFCILTSPWYVAQTRTVSYAPSKSFLVNPEILHSLIGRETENFEREGRRSHSVILGPDNQIIETVTMRTLLNGYETANPIGKKVKNLSLSIFVSLTSRKTLQSFSQSIHKIFHHLGSDITFHTLPLAAFSTVRDSWPTNRDFLIVEVGGEITDVLLSHRGIIEEVVSFPLGENFLYRIVSEHFATLPSEASSLVRSYSAGALASQASDKLNKALEHVKNEWLKSFRKVLELSSLENLLPSSCYVLVNPASAAFFKKFISDPSVATFTSDNKPFKTELLDAQSLQGFFLNTRGAPIDAFQIIPILFTSQVPLWRKTGFLVAAGVNYRV